MGWVGTDILNSISTFIIKGTVILLHTGTTLQHEGTPSYETLSATRLTKYDILGDLENLKPHKTQTLWQIDSISYLTITVV
jgi:hypothetical protein